MKQWILRAASILGLTAALAFPADSQDSRGAGETSRTGPVDFVRDIQPIFRDACISCHGEKKQKGQLRLDSKISALQGGVGGKTLVPGNSRESRLYTILLEPAAEDRMPQKADPLPREKLDLIRNWIDQGASWPDAASVAVGAEKHWSTLKPLRRDPPRPANASWVRNEIDAFIAQGQEARGLRPRPEAPKEALLRRVSIDLVGLPPSPEEAQAFLSDASPDAYEHLVDRLLADPRYGERWGRHWMDVWRYSDWAGFQNEVREGMRHLWRWRDWIVDSLNADKGYDRMVLEMLAGDELAPDDPETLRATGFLARNWVKDRNTWLLTTVEHTAKAFLATTLNCARCHNHFFDPISQREYYQFRAFFEGHNVRTDHVPGETNLEKDGLPRVFDAEPAPSTWLFIRGDEKNPEKSSTLLPGVPRVFGAGLPAITPVSLPLSAIAPDKRDFVVRDLEAQAAQETALARSALDRATRDLTRLEKEALGEGKDAASLEKARQALQAALEEIPGLVLDLSGAEAKEAALRGLLRVEKLEDGGQKGTEEWRLAASETAAAQRQATLVGARKALLSAQRALLKAKGTAEKKGDIPGAQKKVDEAEKALAKAEKDAEEKTTSYVRRTVTTYPSTSSGRRLALARWIVDKENPLAARVAVNHLWMRHFGRPLVPTVFDFGRHGRPPSHPDLLDWLATEFVRMGWSMKRFHKLLLMSATYRMATTPDLEDLAKDPENRFLWRMNPRRMEAEAVRDSILYVSGQLDPGRGGPEIDQRQGLASHRRSLYFRTAAEKQVDFLVLFDGPGIIECYERTESVIPQQSLALLNSSLAQDAARRIARELSPKAPESADFIAHAFRRLLGRPPTGEETKACLEFLDSQSKLLGGASKLTTFAGTAGLALTPAADAPSRAREGLVQVLLNHHEFVTIP
jgi:hypothetical protein